MLTLEEKIKGEITCFQGRIGIAVEIANKRISLNSVEVFPSASVIKVPILIEGLRQAETGKINLNELTTIDKRVGGSGVLQALSAKVSMTIKDLMTLMITVSDNTTTNLLIDLLGMDSINSTIEKLSMEHTKLSRKMMDFEAIEQGYNNFTSPSDMIKCLKVINEGDFLSEESRKLAVEIMHYQQFHDKLTAMMDLDRVFAASKTGGLPNVEHDCAILKYGGKTAYAVVLTDQLDNHFAAKQLISKIGKHLYDHLVEE
ncbi:serine hydrolase [Neobacillus novalis]|uniref:Serine hydrolase n=1 Tax=Neobacillus novalis TaxID=220687 RepID=A0AA95MVS1_9BACI|nr:serine hydrolase [Neobacillus novalis]WHY88296.1 serine hydrolase [Neobacillus novalis]